MYYFIKNDFIYGPNVVFGHKIIKLLTKSYGENFNH